MTRGRTNRAVWAALLTLGVACTTARPAPAPPATPGPRAPAAAACTLVGAQVRWSDVALAAAPGEAPFATIFAPTVDARLVVPRGDGAWLSVQVSSGGVVIDAIVPRGAVAVFAAAPVAIAADLVVAGAPLSLVAARDRDAIRVVPTLPPGLRIAGGAPHAELPCGALALAPDDARPAPPPGDDVALAGSSVVLRATPGGPERFALAESERATPATRLSQQGGWSRIWLAVEGQASERTAPGTWLAVIGWVQDAALAPSVVDGPGVRQGRAAWGEGVAQLDSWRCSGAAPVRLVAPGAPARVVGHVVAGAQLTTLPGTLTLAGRSAAWLAVRDGVRIELEASGCVREGDPREGEPREGGPRRN